DEYKYISIIPLNFTKDSLINNSLIEPMDSLIKEPYSDKILIKKLNKNIIIQFKWVSPSQPNSKGLKN
ncbi:MAG: hypothetical protein MI784_11125, partial [Cytophagales bacterium]|nr:hypothetical protein [Cytophagales bacterium]